MSELLEQIAEKLGYQKHQVNFEETKFGANRVILFLNTKHLDNGQLNLKLRSFCGL